MVPLLNGTLLFASSQGVICSSDLEGISGDQANPLTMSVYRHLWWFGLFHGATSHDCVVC